jgi:hypothetical protein
MGGEKFSHGVNGIDFSVSKQTREMAPSCRFGQVKPLVTEGGRFHSRMGLREKRSHSSYSNADWSPS